MPENKTFDSLLRAAFDAGVQQGIEHPAGTGGNHGDAYRRWRDRWAGLPHEDPGEPPRDAGEAPSYECTEIGCLNHG